MIPLHPAILPGRVPFELQARKFVLPAEACAPFLLHLQISLLLPIYAALSSSFK